MKMYYVHIKQVNNELNLYINLDNEKFSITKSSSIKPYVNQN